jgi:high-affinity nickel-transport protein
MWTTAALTFGLLLGLRHTFEPDHLAAVTTILTETRSLAKMARVGVSWGIGHATSLLVVTLALAALRTEMSARLGDAFELAVAIMLLVLGGRAIRRAFVCTPDRQSCPSHPHDHVHVGRWAFTGRPLIMGLVHGLAGSGLITAGIAARFDGLGARLAFISLFGIGATVGMVSLSSVVGGPLAMVARVHNRARVLGAAAGAFSTVLGVIWAVPLVWRLVR